MWHDRLHFCRNATPPTDIYTLSLHDALPICEFDRAGRRGGGGRQWLLRRAAGGNCGTLWRARDEGGGARSEEHTSELQSQSNLVCRLLLEKKKRPCNPSQARGGGTGAP